MKNHAEPIKKLIDKEKLHITKLRAEQAERRAQWGQFVDSGRPSSEAGSLKTQMDVVDERLIKAMARLSELEAQLEQAEAEDLHERRLIEIKGAGALIQAVTARRAEVGRLAGQLAAALGAEDAAHQQLLDLADRVGTWDAERAASGHASDTFYLVFRDVVPDRALRRGEFDPSEYRLETIDGDRLWPTR